MLYVDDPDEGGDIPESDFHGDFKGSLEFNVYFIVTPK